MRVFDLHCDTLFKFFEDERYSFVQNNGHISDSALADGGYLAQCFAIYQPTDITGDSGFEFFKKQCQTFERMVAQSHNLAVARTRADVEQNRSHGKVSAVLTVENADFLQNRIQRLEAVKQNGVKVLGLVHNGENCLGLPHSADAELKKMPLKRFGREVVDALNSTDITVDVSHLNLGGFYDVVRLSKKPFVATHSGCRALCEHSRNLYDDQIRLIAKSGGVVGCVFYSHFLNGTNRTAAADIIRHLEHLIKVGGEDVAALGTDFDGMECDLFIKTAAKMPELTEKLIKRFGFFVAEKIAFKNAMRIIM